MRIDISRPTDVFERVFDRADHPPLAPGSDPRTGCYTNFVLHDRSKLSHSMHILPDSPPRGHFAARRASSHGRNMASNAGAAPPSSDAARTVTRKIPRDAVVVINILRSMASTRVFSFRDP